VKWLTIVFPKKHVTAFGRIFAKHGFKSWAARTMGEFDCALLTGPVDDSDAVGIDLLKLRYRYPELEKNLLIIDPKGWL